MYICIQGMRDCCETDPIPHSRVHMHKSLAEDLTKIWEPQMLDLYFHELITRKVPTHTFNEHTHTHTNQCVPGTWLSATCGNVDKTLHHTTKLFWPHSSFPYCLSSRHQPTLHSSRQHCSTHHTLTWLSWVVCRHIILPHWVYKGKLTIAAVHIVLTQFTNTFVRTPHQWSRWCTRFIQ